MSRASMSGLSNTNAALSGARRRGALTVLAALAAILAGVAFAGATTTPIAADRSAAADGGAWLRAQLSSTTPLQIAGFADWPLTVQAGLALASTGAEPAVTDPTWNAIVANRELAVTRSGSDVPGRLGFVILLADALGKDPRAVGGEPGADLVARLRATLRTSGPDAGLFGSQTPTFDGAFRQGYSVLGLVAAGETPEPSSLSWLVQQQCSSGGWAGYRPDVAVSCATSGSTAPDSNSTALALSALMASGRSTADPVVSAGLVWLDEHQAPGGGWRLTEQSTKSDPNSTAVAVQALLAADLADDPAYNDQGSPFDVLRSFQVGCTRPLADRGAFTYPGSNGAPNSLATVQVVPALARVTFPIGADEAVVVSPDTLDCSAATTTTFAPTATTTSVAPTTTIVGSPTTIAPAPSRTVATTTVPTTTVTTATVTTAAVPTTTVVVRSTPATSTTVRARVASATVSRVPTASSNRSSTLAVTGGGVGVVWLGLFLLFVGAGALILGRRGRSR